MVHDAVLAAVKVVTSGHGIYIYPEAQHSLWEIVPSIASAIAAGFAVWISILANRRQRAEGLSGVLLAVSERLDSSDNAHLKDEIYKLGERRERYDEWSDEERHQVDNWCAHLDLVALLLMSEQLDMRAFFAIYGDVVLRSVYIVAPYAIGQRAERGEQFLLPLSRLTERLLREWRRLERKRFYPHRIGLKYADVTLTRRSLANDRYVSQFWRRR